MAKVALVTHDVQTINGRAGGVAAFVTHFGRLLRHAGDEVTIILTRQETHPVHVDQNWRSKYAAWGIGLIELHNSEPTPDRWSDTWTARLSEQVTPLLASFDIAYFQDWANVAFHAARVKRFSRAPLPVLVTVLHGSSGWVCVGNQQYPAIPDDFHLEYVERYAARHSDFVVSPCRYMVEWTRRNGWQFPNEPPVLGYPCLGAKVDSERVAASPPASAITKLIFFGRLETRKGFSLFVAALKLLFETHAGATRNLTDIVLLGGEQEAGSLERVRQELAALPVRVTHIGDLDAERAGEYLATNAPDALVVVPSPEDNFPFAVIEASRIPGLRLLCSRGGGTAEIFAGRADAQLFEPYPLGLASKLAEWLREPPAIESLVSYDAESANARWLEFHRAALARAKTPGPRAIPADRVDVCIPHFNQSRYLAQLLRGLEQQTTQEFSVIAVDDGSGAADRDAFQVLADRYRPRGWQFITQANSFVDAARNRAAALSEAPYLLFVDADDYPAPHTIERMLEAITLSGDDCLVAGGILFTADDPITAEAQAKYMPLGPDLVCALLDPVVLGPSMILIRRSVFNAIGGYRQVRGAAHEDWELQIRLVMASYRVDVLPEFLLYFRKSQGGLSLTSSEYEARLRLIETYEDALGKVGLRGLAATVVALLKRRRELEIAVSQSQEARAVRLHALVGDMLRRKSQG